MRTQKPRVAQLLPVALLLLGGCGGSTMETYRNEKSNETLTVLANKGWPRGVETSGLYFVESTGAPSKGSYTKNTDTFILKEEGGKERKLTLQADESLLDETGGVWRHAGHMESSDSVEKNRETCREKKGRDCPY